MIKIAKLNNNIVVNIIAAEKIEDLQNATDYIVVTDQTGDANIGFKYDTVHKIFISPAPYASWTYNFTSKKWESPVAIPNDFGPVKYIWNEISKTWVVYNIPSNVSTNTINVTKV
jgi:hypothetical protein